MRVRFKNKRAFSQRSWLYIFSRSRYLHYLHFSFSINYSPSTSFIIFILIQIQMSKFICATSTTKNTNSSSYHRNWRKYISPLEKLDERTKNWQPKRVQEENRLNQLHEQGKCDIFRSLSSYRYYH